MTVSILAIDQGTTSTKAYKSEEEGDFVAVGSRSHRQIRPGPGHVEHDPEELLASIRSLIEQAGPCAAAGLANQGETVVAWDGATKRPLHNAIVWQDMRTVPAIARLRAAGVEALTLERAGLPLDPYFSAARLAWLLDHAEGAQELRRQGRLRLGTSDAFFLDALTGVFATDVSTASRTSLLNLRTLRWDDALCGAFGVPPDCLPDIRPSAGDFGTLPGAGGGMGARLVTSLVDQQASLFGHGCRRPGDMKVTFGTGAFALGLTGPAPQPNRHGLLPTCAWQLPNLPTQYALDGGVLTAGAAVEWLREIGLLAGMDDLVAFQGPSAAERGLMFVPGQAGLGCPYWDRSARGLWLGMTLDTSRADLCRAVLEGIALRTAQLVQAFGRASGPVGRISIDGGLSRSDYFVRFLADALGRTLHVARTPDLTAHGILQMCRAANGADGAASTPPFGWRQVHPESALPEAIPRRFAAAVERSRAWDAAVAP